MAFIGAWAFGEAIVLPVVPDVALALLALASPRRAGALFGAVLVGAVSGSILLAAATSAAPASVDAMLLAVPGIDADTIATVDARLAADGVPRIRAGGTGAAAQGLHRRVGGDRRVVARASSSACC